jgi:hypothetical protein
MAGQKVKTRLGDSPWPTVPRRAVKVYEAISVTDLSLVNDKIPQSKRQPGSKYHALFNDCIKTGKAIKTPAGAASTISNIARTWLRRQGLEATIRSVGNFGDGSGRVWITATEKRAA